MPHTTGQHKKPHPAGANNPSANNQILKNRNQETPLDASVTNTVKENAVAKIDKATLRLACMEDIPYISQGAMQLAQQEVDGSKLQLSETLLDELTLFYHAAIKDPTMLLLIAESEVANDHVNESKAIGFLVGAILPSPNNYTTLRQYACIHTLWISQAHRKQGIAKHLVRAFERTVAKHGILIVDVAHVVSNISAERFWHRLGYAAACVTRRKHIS